MLFRSDQLAKQAAVKVAEAQVTRAEAAVSTARIRLGYTQVVAAWSGGDDERVVGQRLVEEGDTVAANTPLFSIVELDPITAVIFLTGRDYGRLKPGQLVTLTTDAYPQREFGGAVTRVAPVFQEASRQARAELTVANPQQLLKPGMFVRAAAVLEELELMRFDDAEIERVVGAHGSLDVAEEQTDDTAKAGDAIIERGLTAIDVVRALAARGYDVEAERVLEMTRQRLFGDHLQTSAIFDEDMRVLSALTDPNDYQGPEIGRAHV